MSTENHKAAMPRAEMKKNLTGQSLGDEDGKDGKSGRMEEKDESNLPKSIDGRNWAI